MKLAAAGAIVALAVGLVLPGVLTSPTSDGTSTGTSPTGESTIHWRSDVVDLQADGMTLRIGDEVYTTEGADVLVLANDGSLGSWALYPRWIENGQVTWLEFSFRSDGETWTVHPFVRFDAPVRTAPEPERRAPRSLSHHVSFNQREEVRVPLGEALTGPT